MGDTALTHTGGERPRAKNHKKKKRRYRKKVDIPAAEVSAKEMSAKEMSAKEVTEKNELDSVEGLEAGVMAGVDSIGHEVAGLVETVEKSKISGQKGVSQSVLNNHSHEHKQKTQKEEGQDKGEKILKNTGSIVEDTAEGTVENTVENTGQEPCIGSPPQPFISDPIVQSEIPDPFTPGPISPSSVMSPRKQAIMRYKKSDDSINIFSELKGSLKSTEKTKSPAAEVVIDLKKSQVHVDEKLALFNHKSSKILVFDEEQDTSKQSSSIGRLLGHGEFEIFQLHNGDVTYLSCGPSFIYPLLPKLKVLRVEFNQFILPLVNPDRYWKIFINTDDVDVVERLEAVFESTVQYRNLAIGARPPGLSSSLQPSESIATSTDKSIKSNDKSNGLLDSNHNDQSNHKLQDSLKFNLALPNDIPDSPPSAPLSPHQNAHVISNFQLGSPLKPVIHTDQLNIPRDDSNKSISSAMASFDIGKDSKMVNLSFYPDIPRYQEVPEYPKPRNLHKYPQEQKYPHEVSKYPQEQKYESHKHPRPHSPNKQKDTKSESSMDSLLDEYEESMSVSKSFTYSKSRPMSRSSSFIHMPQQMPHGSLGVNTSMNIDSNRMMEYKNPHPSPLTLDEFPTTSLSEYNRVHARSRRSSRSELYTSESNWMEPNKNTTKSSSKNGRHLDSQRLPYSRSTYSVSSGQGHDSNDLGTTYRQIYKSITQRNLSSFVESDVRSVRSQSRLPTIEQSKALKTQPTALKKSNLNSNEVYKMLNETPKQVPTKKGITRLFGW